MKKASCCWTQFIVTCGLASVFVTGGCSYDASQLRALPDAADGAGGMPGQTDAAGTGGQTDAGRSEAASSLDARGIPISDGRSDGLPADTSDVGSPHDAAVDGPFIVSCSTGYHNGGAGN